jgi:hypothetical protein
MKSETEVILEELKQIRANLEHINRRLSRTELEREFEPKAVSLQQASQMLSQGLTKTKEMIRDGEMETALIGRRTMVPISEVNRLAAPRPKHQMVAEAKTRAHWKPIVKKKR